MSDPEEFSLISLPTTKVTFNQLVALEGINLFLLDTNQFPSHYFSEVLGQLGTDEQKNFLSVSKMWQSAAILLAD